MGYVEQADCLVGHHTVRESLDFSAALRLPSSVSDETRTKFVDQIVEDLELTDMQNRMVGDANVEGLSPGEMKRLTIGQLAARIICDELVATWIGFPSCQQMLTHIFFRHRACSVIFPRCSGVELAANPTFLFLG